MKNFKFSVASLALFFMILTSCSKDEVSSQDPEKAVLSFGAILKDFGTNGAALRQALEDIPECSDATADYVEIILSRGGTNVIGSQDTPFRVDLVTGQVFTEEVPELELEPGDYSLDYFAVFDALDNPIWVAPIAGSAMANLVATPLPLAIDLRAGVKKYVDVPVLCFDDRVVNSYGYQFFDLVPGQVIEWCIFGNYCDETGRHYPAEFSVDIWRYVDGQRGAQLYNDEANEVTLDGGDYAGSTVCVALPDLNGLDEYYVEITLRDSDAYGNITERIIREGVISDADVRDLFTGAEAMEYYHFREGCDGEDGPDLFPDSPITYMGPVNNVGNGTAWSFVKFNNDGGLEAIGIRFTEEALFGLPDHMVHNTLLLPEEADGIIYDHVDLDWNPEGHEPPGIYDLPHFDIHFYMITVAEKMGITDAALGEILPDEIYWPETYFPTPGMVPMMGKHWLSGAAGEVNGEVFDHTFIYGSYNGDFIFYEPMITRDYLLQKTSDTFSIFQPDAFERSGYYPTTYSINYNAVAKEYTVVMEGMVWR